MELALVRHHLRIDHEDDDALLLQYVSAAKAHVELHCDRAIVEGRLPILPSEMALTPDIVQAVLVLVAHWYANREAVVAGTISSDIQLSFERILWYRKQF